MSTDAAGASGGAGEIGFTHLHLHTEYSLLDGGNQIEKLVDRVAELGMKACAITDHGNLFGAVAFALACKERGIKPILGVEAYVTPPGKPRSDRTYSGGGEGGYHLVLLAENTTGWQNLLVLCSEAYLTGFYYKPRIDRELLAKHSEGLIAINGHLGSEIGDHLLAYERSGDQKHWDLAVESARWHAASFGGGATRPRFFIELQHHVPEQNAINAWLIKLARQEGLPLVCDNDAHFLRAEDHDAHDTLICISTATNKDAEQRMRYPREVYVKSPAEMEALFAQYGEAGREALDNSAAIARRCHVDLPLGRNNAPAVLIDLPDPATLPRREDPKYAGDASAWYAEFCSTFELRPFKSTPTQEELAASKKSCDAALRMLAEAGFEWRYGAVEHPRRGADPRRARLERELKILADKDISAYFLIVWDFVNWGRQRGIPAIARGSGVGTMVGYVLGLSNACPEKYGLLFERFTDPDRGEYPDIDIDLCQDGRGRVINYVREKYGHVAQIITFGTLKARAAIRDVGRVLGMSIPDVDRVAKLVPEQLNITIREAMEKEPDLRRMYESDDRCRRLLDNAIALEGHTRHAGVHAAGVIVATRPLQEIVPLYRPAGSEENELITQWDGPTCEKLGLLKMDFLGLRTLSVIERAKALIRATMNDREIWEAVGRADGHNQWQSGRVAQWQSGEAAELQGERQDFPGPGRVAARDGAGPRDLPCDGANAQVRNVRADQPDASGGVVDPDEHRGGVRKALTPRVRARASDRDGLAAGTHDRIRTGHFAEDDPRIAEGTGVARGRGPASERDRSLARGQDQAGAPTRQAEGLTESEGDGELVPGCVPLCHSATSPLHPHPLDLDRLDYADQRVFELFRRGETTGVFQFESGGMRRLLQEMKPDRLEDLIAANALFRPGPMDLIPTYNRRKHKLEGVPSVHPIVDRFTAETYGVMVYQEQVMQIVHGLGGISLRDAYTLIKNISKKKHDKIEKERPKFVRGAQEQGLTAAQAEELFELILKFAGYGFNKSHSTGYAIVAYQTAYLKTYFPNQYMAAFLTYESQAQKVSQWTPYLEDCKRTRFIDPRTGTTVRTGVEVRPPDINRSQADFAVVFEDGESGAEGMPRAHLGHIRFGLSAIKGVGDKAIRAIIDERDGRGAGRAEGGATPSPFTSLFEFCERVPAGTINKAMLESLVQCGAFDGVHGREQRSAMSAAIEQAMSAGQKLAADKASGQGSLFGLGSGPATTARAAPAMLPKVTPWGEAETLANEKAVLGFYVSSHPLDRHRAWASAFATTTIAGVRERKQDERVVLAAMVQSVRQIVVRNGRSAGQKMGILTIEDLTGTLDAVLFTDNFAAYGHLATGEATLFVLGRTDHSRGDAQVVVDKLVPIDGVPFDAGKVRIVVDERRLNGSGPATLARVAELVRSRAQPTPAKSKPGDAAPMFPLEIVVGIEDQYAVLAADAKFKLPVDPPMMGAIQDELGEGMVRVVGVTKEPAAGEKRRQQRGSV